MDTDIAFTYATRPIDVNAEALDLRQKYTHFRVLVIGRANAGKTTLLKRVCNTTDDPHIYDEGKNLVCFLSHRHGYPLIGQLDRANFQGILSEPEMNLLNT